MNGTFAHPERVSVSAVERIQRNMADLLQAIGDALSAADLVSPHSTRWQRALGLLTDEQVRLQAGVDAFNKGDRQPLLQQAADLRLLTRSLDGYLPYFAGNDAGRKIASQQQLLVFTAWQIAAVASGVEGAGI